MRYPQRLSEEIAMNKYLAHPSPKDEREKMLNRRMKELHCRHVPTEKVSEFHVDKLFEEAQQKHGIYETVLMMDFDYIPDGLTA